MSKPRMTLDPKPRLDKLARKLMTKKDMLELAAELTKDIRDRTQKKNVDYQGVPFRKYSEDYAIWKGSRKVDLTGITAGARMLLSMKQKANKKEAVIFFEDRRKNAIAYKNNKTRTFFEASKKNEKDVVKNYEKALAKKIKEWERL